MNVFWCGECGLAVCKNVEGFDDTVVFAGTLDDGGETMKRIPQAEMWTSDRLGWCGEVGGGKMMGFEGFPPGVAAGG